MSERAWCDCDWRQPFSAKGGVLVCSACGGVIECEFVYLDDRLHAATQEHVDYRVCDEHLGIAVDNVHGRGWV